MENGGAEILDSCVARVWTEADAKPLLCIALAIAGEDLFDDAELRGCRTRSDLSESANDASGQRRSPGP